MALQWPCSSWELGQLSAHWRTLPLRPGHSNCLLPTSSTSLWSSENCPRSSCGNSACALTLVYASPSPFSHLTKEKQTPPAILHVLPHTRPQCVKTCTKQPRKRKPQIRERKVPWEQSRGSFLEGNPSRAEQPSACPAPAAHLPWYSRQVCHGCHHKTVSWIENDLVKCFFFPLSEHNFNLSTGLTVEADFAHEEIQGAFLKSISFYFTISFHFIHFYYFKIHF